MFFSPIWVIDSNFESKFKNFWYKNYLFLSWILLDLFVFFVLLSCDSTISEVTKKNSTFCHLISIFCPWKLMQLGHGAWWRAKLCICWFCCTLISSVLGPRLPVRLCTHTAALKEVKSGSGSTNLHLVLGKPLRFLKITMVFFKNSAVAAAPAANVHMTLMSIL